MKDSRAVANVLFAPICIEDFRGRVPRLHTEGTLVAGSEQCGHRDSNERMIFPAFLDARSRRCIRPKAD